MNRARDDSKNGMRRPLAPPR